MAPPSTKPVLSKIDPDALGADLAARLRDHVGRLALSCGLRVDDGGPPDLRYSVADLARYARDGGGLDAPVEEYLVSLLPLWSAALGDAPTPLDVIDDASLDEPIGVVLVSAVARERIAQGEAVSTAQLAALASLSPRQVQQLVAREEIAADDGGIAAAEARRWLSGRGLAGFAKKTAPQP